METPKVLRLRVFHELSPRRLIEAYDQAKAAGLPLRDFITRRMCALDMAPQKRQYLWQLQCDRGVNPWRT
jgi:hypothetical protein